MQDPSQREDLWDPLKYISLAREGWYLTLAGEIRPFYEIYHNYNWGAGPQDGNGYYLQRIMGSTDLHLGGRIYICGLPVLRCTDQQTSVIRKS